MNIDELSKLFDGKSAHGVGGFFSSAMGKGPSYLARDVEDLLIDVGDGDAEVGDDNNGDNEEQVNLTPGDLTPTPMSVPEKVSRKTTNKRKCEDAFDIENKRRQASFDKVISLLSAAAAPPVAPSTGLTKSERICEELTRMGIAEKFGDDYFVSAIRYLGDAKHADNFLALKNDNQKFIYMKGKDIDC